MALSVSVEELRQVAADLDNKRDEIREMYNGKIKDLFLESKDVISATGLDFDDFIVAFSQAFNGIDADIHNLSKLLVGDIIPKYESLHSYINTGFNREFADQMQFLLNRIKGD